MHGRVICVFWVALGVASPTMAQGFGDPRGGPNPGHPGWAEDSDAECRWRSEVFVGTRPPLDGSNTTLQNALAATNFSPPRWELQRPDQVRPLSGSVDIVDYYAWVTNYGTVQCGDFLNGFTETDAESGRRGGAVMCLEYNPGPGDPPRGSVHWLQTVHTNCPEGNTVPAGDAGGGFVDFLDIGRNPRDADGNYISPFYDTGYTANGFYFLDIPWRRCHEGVDCTRDCTVVFQTFLAIQTVGADGVTPRLELYSPGLTWGYHFTCTPIPAPAAWVCAIALLTVRRRRRAGGA